MIKGRPPRLGLVFQTYDPPLYFVTVCTLLRRRIGNLGIAQRAFEEYGSTGLKEFNVAVGRYVLMPDHLHLFVQGGEDFVLGHWVKGLKRAISTAVNEDTPGLKWQPGFFDHLLRNDESYSEKWQYVYENPVRAGLVGAAHQWPYQGEIVLIDRAV